MHLTKILAQNPKNLAPIRGLGPLGLEGTSPSQGGTMFTKALSLVVGFMTIVAGIWFIFQFITAGYGFISAGGKPDEIQKAQQKIMNSFIGIAIVVAAIFILSLVGHLLHVDFLDIPKAVRDLSP